MSTTNVTLECEVSHPERNPSNRNWKPAIFGHPQATLIGDPKPFVACGMPITESPPEVHTSQVIILHQGVCIDLALASEKA